LTRSDREIGPASIDRVGNKRAHPFFIPEAAAGRSLKPVQARHSGRPDVRAMYDPLPRLPRRKSGRIRADRIARDLRRFFVPFRGNGESHDRLSRRETSTDRPLETEFYVLRGTSASSDTALNGMGKIKEKETKEGNVEPRRDCRAPMQRHVR